MFYIDIDNFADKLKNADISAFDNFLGKAKNYDQSHIKK